MRTRDLILAALFIISFVVNTAHAEDWAQAAANPARIAHVSDEPRGRAKTLWVKRFDDEVMQNTNQPIIVGGIVFVGTANGVIHAVDAESGNEKWTAKTGGPVINALASDGKCIYAASMDGALYAFDITDGNQKWMSRMSRRGFSTAPLLMNGRLYTGNRDGIMYALSAEDGGKVWDKDTGAPIEQTAAGAQGKIVFVNKAMQAYCLDAGSGQILWQKPVIGSSVRDYWPVIFKGKVIIRTRQAGPRGLSSSMNELQNGLFFPARYAEPKPEDIKFKAKTKEDIFKEQKWIQEYFDKNPQAHTWAVLSLSDGSEPYKVGIVAGCCNTGTIPPPAVAGDGRVYTPFPTSASRNGVVNITRLGLGSLNLDTGIIDQPLCGGGEGVSEVIGVRTPFELTSDETVGLSSGGDLIVGIRGDMNPGGINVKTRQTQRMDVPPRPRSQDSQPGANIVAISGKYLAYVKNSELICLAAESSLQKDEPELREQQREARRPQRQPDRETRWVNPPNEPFYIGNNKCEPFGTEDRPMPERVSHATFYSEANKHDIGYTIYLPPGYETSEARYPVLYFLHGGGGNEWMLWENLDRRNAPNVGRLVKWDEVEKINGSRFFTDLIESGKVPPVIIVCINGGRSSGYSDSERRGSMAETMFIKEFIPHIDGKYRTIAAKNGRAIEGFSMGGGGTLNFTFKYPDIFCSAIIYGAGISGRRPESANLIKDNAENARGKVQFRIVIGQKDRGLPSAQNLRDLFKELQIEHEFEILPGVPHQFFQYHRDAGQAGILFHCKALAKS